MLSFWIVFFSLVFSRFCWLMSFLSVKSQNVKLFSARALLFVHTGFDVIFVCHLPIFYSFYFYTHGICHSVQKKKKTNGFVKLLLNFDLGFSYVYICMSTDTHTLCVDGHASPDVVNSKVKLCSINNSKSNWIVYSCVWTNQIKFVSHSCAQRFFFSSIEKIDWNGRFMGWLWLCVLFTRLLFACLLAWMELSFGALRTRIVSYLNMYRHIDMRAHTMTTTKTTTTTHTHRYYPQVWQNPMFVSLPYICVLSLIPRMRFLKCTIAPEIEYRIEKFKLNVIIAMHMRYESLCWFNANCHCTFIWFF